MHSALQSEANLRIQLDAKSNKYYKTTGLRCYRITDKDNDNANDNDGNNNSDDDDDNDDDDDDENDRHSID